MPWVESSLKPHLTSGRPGKSQCLLFQHFSLCFIFGAKIEKSVPGAQANEGTINHHIIYVSLLSVKKHFD